MVNSQRYQAPSRSTPETHQRQEEKLSRIPIKVETVDQPLRKPPWIRIKVAASPEVSRIKKSLRENNLFSVCEEAACPNLNECFSQGTATFMIMGDRCTRRCPFCDVAHGRPEPLDVNEPEHLAKTIEAMRLRYVVITSVDRDDLRDGGASHFAASIQAIRARNPAIRIEILTPDFRGRIEPALTALAAAPPDLFNHNLETVPRLYRQVRPGADYTHSLKLIRQFKEQQPTIPTKSGLMLGLGETLEEVETVMHDLIEHHCNLLTLGQYLQPSRQHLPVIRYIPPETFDQLAKVGEKMGFTHVAAGPLVRSSYHADNQAKHLGTSFSPNNS